MPKARKKKVRPCVRCAGLNQNMAGAFERGVDAMLRTAKSLTRTQCERLVHIAQGMIPDDEEPQR